MSNKTLLETENDSSLEQLVGQLNGKNRCHFQTFRYYDRFDVYSEVFSNLLYPSETP